MNATEAPIPTLLPLAPPLEGSASETFATSTDAARVTSPAPVMVTFGAPTASPRRARVSEKERLMATEPATPVLPPPAPEVAVAWNVSDVPAEPARRMSPAALIVDAPMKARFPTLA